MSNVTTTPNTIEAQITAVKSLVQQQILTPEQGLARMAAIHSSAAGNGSAGSEERKPPRVARTPMVMAGPTQDQLLQELSTGKITVEEFKSMSAGMSAKIDLAVSAKGWFSMYVKGMRFPITIPVDVAEALTSEAGAAFVRAFIATNSSAFDRK
jgi:hypothetical protein